MTRAGNPRGARVFPGPAGLGCWLLCTAAAWYWAVVYGGQAAWFVAAATGFLMLYAVIALWGFLEKPVVSRSVTQEQVHAGESVRVRLTIHRRTRWFPLAWVIVGDELRGADGKTAYVHQRLLFLGLRERIEDEYEIPRLRRGMYTFGAADVRAAEPLGLVGRRWKLDGAAGRRLTVYPQPLDWQAADLPRRAGDSRAAVTAAMAAASPLVSTVREYAHGDPLQRIHWKSTARTGELKTKELDALQERRVVVVLDDAAAAYGRGRTARARFETAASAACAVLQAAKRHGLAAELRCGAAAAAAEAEAPGPAGRRALELLARAEPRGEAALADALREQGWRRLAAEVPLIVITPQLDARLLEQLGMLRARRIGVTLLYVSEAADAEGQAALQLRQLEIMGCRTGVIAVEPAHGQAPYRGQQAMGGAAAYG